MRSGYAIRRKLVANMLEIKKIGRMWILFFKAKLAVPGFQGRCSVLGVESGSAGTASSGVRG